MKLPDYKHIFKLKNKSSPEWAEKEGEFEGWRAVRTVEHRATRQARTSKIWLALVLFSLPVSLLSCVVSMNARTGSNAAIVTADQAVVTVEERFLKPDPLYQAEAVAAVINRLGRAGHPFETATFVPQSFDIVDVGEDHRVSVIARGIVVMEARSVITESGQTIGVTFQPPATYAPEQTVILGGFYLPDTVLTRLRASFGETEQPGGRGAWDAETGQLSIKAYEGLAEGGISLAEYYPDFVHHFDFDEAVIRERLEIWLTAWASNDQAGLREVGDYTDVELLPWSRFEDYKYQKDSLVILGSVAFGNDYIIHIRFALRDQLGAILFQDLEVEVRPDGQILRVLGGSPIGEIEGTG